MLSACQADISVTVQPLILIQVQHLTGTVAMCTQVQLPESLIPIIGFFAVNKNKVIKKNDNAIR